LHDAKEVSYLLSEPGNYLRQLSFTPDGKKVILGGYIQGRRKEDVFGNPAWEEDSPCLRFWDYRAKKVVLTLKDIGDRAFAISPDGKLLAISAYNRTARVKIIDLESGRTRKDYVVSKGEIHTVLFNPSGRVLAAIDDGEVFGLHDLEKSQMLFRFAMRTPAKDISAIHLSSNGKQLLTAHNNESIVRLWDMESGKEMAQCRPLDPMFATGMSQACFVPKHKCILMCDEEHVHAWDPVRRQVLWSLQNKHFPEYRRWSTRIICNLVVSPDGKHFATISNDSKGSWCHIWEFPP
jgi:WD40 repeat protein